MSHVENNERKAQVYISRHRIGSDGAGIRTLLSFTGCNLDCKYCINKELRSTTSDGRWYTPEELLDDVLIDKYYFLVSGGGVTFSGGEPLLHSEFICEFAELASQHGIDMCVETSLNVPETAVTSVCRYISKWIVDIKECRPEVYEKYTGCSMELVYKNISLLRFADAKVHFRIPIIPGYNTKSDVEDAMDSNYVDWAYNIELFEYVTCKSGISKTDGKRTCLILKAVRKQLMMNLYHFCVQPECTHTGDCLGTCPICEQEMEKISHDIDALPEDARNKIIDSVANKWQEVFMDKFAVRGTINNIYHPNVTMGAPARSVPLSPIQRLKEYFENLFAKY